MSREAPSLWPQAGDGLVYLSTRAMARLRRSADKLPLKAIKILNPLSGSHLSRFKGRGMEFDEACPYQAGDDIRNLDWRVTARSGRAHTKLFREERERSVLFWVDFRSNMQFATRGRFKTVLASEAAALLAWATRRQGNRNDKKHTNGSEPVNHFLPSGQIECDITPKINMIKTCLTSQ